MVIISACVGDGDALVSAGDVSACNDDAMVGDGVGDDDSDYDDDTGDSDASTYEDYLENISGDEDVQDFDIVCPSPPSSVIEISSDDEEIAVVPSELKTLYQVHTVTLTKKTMFLGDNVVGRSHTVEQDYFEILK
ncbi:hypothetical protein DPMN_162703 [Dreissena polymorpha]|uniref:Uncharacterized protein n=1 Tax=Dreissena polymorpha TaxID=45954 RepID=A0A9D4EUM5_DREPO|nr:hypothetical protein DPMN_162703 [Dreissena polymorpha]